MTIMRSRYGRCGSRGAVGVKPTARGRAEGHGLVKHSELTRPYHFRQRLETVFLSTFLEEGCGLPKQIRFSLVDLACYGNVAEDPMRISSSPSRGVLPSRQALAGRWGCSPGPSSRLAVSTFLEGRQNPHMRATRDGPFATSIADSALPASSHP
jgi:hypothetical protein